jgi:dTMP kinase
VFLVFEGGEGSGKSTQADLLAAALAAAGRDVVVTREPGATNIGERIRSLLLDRRLSSGLSGVVLAPRAEALLYAADRAHHVATVVRPALERGAVVISDRYSDSSLAYQGAGRILPVEEVSWLSAWATAGLRPDLVILLDIDPSVGLARVRDRGPADRLEVESMSFHERVRYAFLDLAAADPRRYLVVDATLTPDEITAIVTDRVQGLPAMRRDTLEPLVPLGRPDAEPTPPPAVAVEPPGSAGNGRGPIQSVPNPTSSVRSNVDVP